MRPSATAALAAGSLVVGFAVAQLTGIRWLGGLVLVAAAVLCGRQWQRVAGWPVAATLLALCTGAFVASHGLARPVGAWPSVLLVAAVVGVVSWLVTRRVPVPRR